MPPFSGFPVHTVLHALSLLVVVGYASDFQPVFRGKLVFRERSSGVPQEI